MSFLLFTKSITIRCLTLFLVTFLVPINLIAKEVESPTPATPKVSEFMLDNGLKLLVKEDHRAPVVVTQVWYRVGSSYEYGGIRHWH